MLAATDVNTDIGAIMEENGFGWGSESGDLEGISRQISELAEDPKLRRTMGDKGCRFLLDHYNVDVLYQAVMKSQAECTEL